MAKKTKKKTKLEKLRAELERKGGTFTHKDCAKILLRGTGVTFDLEQRKRNGYVQWYEPNSARWFDPLLYGRWVNNVCSSYYKYGFLKSECTRLDHGVYCLNKTKKTKQRSKR